MYLKILWYLQLLLSVTNGLNKTMKQKTDCHTQASHTTVHCHYILFYENVFLLRPRK